MIDNAGHPRLMDFFLVQGVGSIAEKMGSSPASSSIRWSAPEDLIGDPPLHSRTEKSDVYAFACTYIEVGNTGISKCHRPSIVIFSKLILLKAPYQGLSDQEVSRHVSHQRKLPRETYTNGQILAK
jgi:Protein tyrosine and serine/threonine kinase